MRISDFVPTKSMLAKKYNNSPRLNIVLFLKSRKDNFLRNFRKNDLAIRKKRTDRRSKNSVPSRNDRKRACTYEKFQRKTIRKGQADRKSEIRRKQSVQNYLQHMPRGGCPMVRQRQICKILCELHFRTTSSYVCYPELRFKMR